MQLLLNIDLIATILHAIPTATPATANQCARRVEVLVVDATYGFCGRRLLIDPILSLYGADAHNGLVVVAPGHQGRAAYATHSSRSVRYPTVCICTSSTTTIIAPGAVTVVVVVVVVVATHAIAVRYGRDRGRRGLIVDAGRVEGGGRRMAVQVAANVACAPTRTPTIRQGQQDLLLLLLLTAVVHIRTLAQQVDVHSTRRTRLPDYYYYFRTC
jgi:hypothetical protein